MASYNKRAKWIEGITQSNRILRDIAEIATTALRTEEGISQEENWELIFPRPFKETPIEYGRLIPNPDREEDAPNVDFIPVEDVTEYTPLFGIMPYELKRDDVIDSTVIVTSEGGATRYIEGEDYEFDADTKSVRRIDTGAIPDGITVRIFYGVKLFSLLSYADVHVYEKLKVSNPYRPISPLEYEIDRSNGTITFTGEMPTNAQKYLLSFTEASDLIENTEHNRIALELDYLDPNLRTFKIPSEYGRMRHLSEVIPVASTSGGINASGANGYVLDGVNHKVTFHYPMKLETYNELRITVYEFIDAAKSGTREIITKLIHDLSDDTNRTFVLDGTFNELNPMLAHSVEAEVVSDEISLEYQLPAVDAGVEVIEPSSYRVDHETTVITFLDEQDETTEFQVSCVGNGEYDLEEGLRKIKNRIVLKTTTEPEVDVEGIIGGDYGARDTADKLEMYVEMIKPENLIHPETGMTIYSDHEGATKTTQQNNHFIQCRMFDKWDDIRQAPTLDVGDKDGNIEKRGAYVSEWSKYSWFKDWKEYLVDELDATPGSSDLSKGLLLQEVRTPGLTDEFPIQFWISTNNNRMAMILMGDPTLDQDNFLTSFAYFGRIHPFFDTQCVVKKDDSGTILLDSNGDPVLEEKRTYFENDVKGNFALTVGSSTIPANVSQPPDGQPVIVSGDVLGEIVEVPVLDEKGNPVLDENDNPIMEYQTKATNTGALYDGTTYSYIVTFLTPEGESKPSERYGITAEYGAIDGSLTQTKGVTTKITFRLPDEATGYRIYRAWSPAKPTIYEWTCLARTPKSRSYGITYYWEVGETWRTTNPNAVPANYQGHVPSRWRTDIINDYSLDADVMRDWNNWKLVLSVDQLNTVNREFEFEDDGMFLGVEDENEKLVKSNHAYFSTVRGAVPVARGYESVIRDVHTGSILEVKFSQRYGKETGTGVNDIVMFQTRSGLKYQRHYASFITTEEFIKKERSGQSRWTGKFHLSPIYIEHAYDKQRGWLDGVMAVDDAGVEHLDDLIVGKDTPNEEVYKFFRVNAPYSMFNNSANYAYGIAIIKSSMKWE